MSNKQSSASTEHTSTPPPRRVTAFQPEPLVKLKLKRSKVTKGTFVYSLVGPNGMEVGSIYLPKLLLPSEPGEIITMALHDGDLT